MLFLITHLIRKFFTQTIFERDNGFAVNYAYFLFLRLGIREKFQWSDCLVKMQRGGAEMLE